MKRLSDYKGEEAITLWADLLEKFTEILSDEEVVKAFRSKKPALLRAKVIMTRKPKEAGDLLLRIDPTPLNGLNVITRMATLIDEIMKDSDMMVFFGSSSEENKTSSGDVMENTKEAETSTTSSDM